MLTSVGKVLLVAKVRSKKLLPAAATTTATTSEITQITLTKILLKRSQTKCSWSRGHTRLELSFVSLKPRPNAPSNEIICTILCVLRYMKLFIYISLRRYKKPKLCYT